VEIVTNELAHLTLVVPDITDILTSFTRARWYRSRGGTLPYEPATAAAAAPAFLQAGFASSAYALNGRRLHLMINGVTEIDYAFVGADPVSLATAISELTAETPDVVLSAGTNGAPRLTTLSAGGGASIKAFDDDDALVYLNISELEAVGRGVDTTLVSGTTVYEFEDPNGRSDWTYRVQYLHHTTGLVSPMGSILGVDPYQTVPYAQTSMAYLRLVDHGGRALIGRQVSVVSTEVPAYVTGSGLFRHATSAVTDSTGLATFRLLRGSVVELSIDGTTFTRRFTVPALPSFNMLDPSLVTTDVFGIAEFNVPFAIRTSL
jgi:hypothetical protein